MSCGLHDLHNPGSQLLNIAVHCRPACRSSKLRHKVGRLTSAYCISGRQQQTETGRGSAFYCLHMPSYSKLSQVSLMMTWCSCPSRPHSMPPMWTCPATSQRTSGAISELDPHMLTRPNASWHRLKSFGPQFPTVLRCIE